MLDWLAAGLDPEKAYIYRQSDLPEIAELFLALAMIIPLAWLERVPTYKEQLVQLNHKEINTFGFLGYPALQAADILSVQADAVPVGEDQLPHLELTREIARRFNFLYGDYFSEPASMLSPVHQDRGHRRAQDEQELRQRHHLERHPRGDHGQGAGDDHRPGPRHP